MSWASSLARVLAEHDPDPAAAQAGAHQDVLRVRDLPGVVARLIVGAALDLLRTLHPVADAVQAAFGDLAAEGVDWEFAANGDAAVLDPLVPFAGLAVGPPA